MAKFIGRLINVGFGIESTTGTAVAVQNFQPKTNITFDEKLETIQDESSVNSIVDSQGTEIVKRWAEGDVEGYVSANSIWYLMLATLWAVATTDEGGGVYEHIFSLLNSNSHPSLTIGTNDPVSGDYAFAGAMVESLRIGAEEGGFATFTATLKAKPGASGSHTVTYTADDNFLARHSIFKIADNQSWLSTASAICLKSFEINISKNLEDDFCLGSQTPTGFINKQFTVDGSFTAHYTNETYKDIVLDGDQKAIRFQLVDTTKDIGGTNNPTLTIDLYQAGFTEWSKTQGNDEVVAQTITFKGSVLAGDSIVATLLNNTAQYVAGS